MMPRADLLAIVSSAGLGRGHGAVDGWGAHVTTQEQHAVEAADVVADSHQPGIMVGPTSEFSLFFHVKPGHGPALRDALRELQSAPGYRAGDYELPIATIHEARFVPFDDDTRLLFATSFDGPWDAYMEDFAAKPLRLFDAIFQHVEGYEGLPDLQAVKEFILSAQVSAGGYARNYGGTVKQIRKAVRVDDAFQRVLDDPA